MQTDVHTTAFLWVSLFTTEHDGSRELLFNATVLLSSTLAIAKAVNFKLLPLLTLLPLLPLLFTSAVYFLKVYTCLTNWAIKLS